HYDCATGSMWLSVCCHDIWMCTIRRLCRDYLDGNAHIWKFCLGRIPYRLVQHSDIYDAFFSWTNHVDGSRSCSHPQKWRFSRQVSACGIDVVFV
ncbi:hypothetical protein GCK32_017928, partial [Trichostrongylus colubriformis]